MPHKEEKKRILVVDDEFSILKFMEKALGKSGYHALIASSVSEAIKILEITPVDLVITDCKMPRMSGMDLIRHVKENFRFTAVLMITGHPSIEGAVAAVRIGAEDYLTKPFTVNELLTAVRRAIEKLSTRKLGAGENNDLSPAPYGIIGRSEAMLKVFDAIGKAARTTATVLITGGSGTGKELVARAIHYSSSRAAAPFIPVNCGGIPEEFLDSELFGSTRHEEDSKSSLFGAADSGTIFFDGIGNLTHTMQTKLLRVIQDKEISTTASGGTRRVDVHLLASTNRDLLSLVSSGAFREDLYYRINVVPISLPPLRDCGGDILIMASHFAARYANELGKPAPRFSDFALQVLKSYPWPGNVRELENLMQSLVVMGDRDLIDVTDLPPHMRFTAFAEGGRIKSLAEIENEYIHFVLASMGGNKSQAADILGMDRKTLREKLKKMGVVDAE
ncbi:MAG: sigma-54 dependent transcriptional regulator [Candidatus Eremiobacteraeota bacterium]|nr:sigma-54 dependent transcriptional regulator [Candidatus Eremiobacteraeota bacterium]